MAAGVRLRHVDEQVAADNVSGRSPAQAHGLAPIAPCAMSISSAHKSAWLNTCHASKAPELHLVHVITIVTSATENVDDWSMCERVIEVEHPATWCAKTAG